MSLPLEPGYVIPKPQTARVFGILNILYGTLLLFFAYTGLLMYQFAPVGEALLRSFMGSISDAIRTEQENAVRKVERLVELAQTDTQRAKYQQRLDQVKANPTPDFAAMPMGMDALREPAFKRYNVADNLTGVPISLLLVLSGIGLLGLRELARKLAIGASAAKVLVLFGLLVYALAVVYPIQQRIAMKQLEAQQKLMAGMQRGAVANPMANPQMMALMSASGSASGLFWFAVLGAYPVVVIWMLTRPPVRAACLVHSQGDDAFGKAES
jgi:hypothetical protein